MELKYIAGPNLNQYFVDKETGLPMSGGRVEFYSDINRSMPKPVFKISGSPPSYSYTDIGSEITINSDGSVGDGMGNNIFLYYYPYDADGNIELYFARVFNSMDVPQYTREAWPPNVEEETSNEQGLDVTNYIPNGQFWSHNNIPGDVITGRPDGQVPFGISSLDMAPGGLVFQRQPSSLAIDYLTFQRNVSYLSSPSQSPRYTLRLSCASPSPSDVYKTLGWKFSDVNKFASNDQQYTFSFWAKTDASVDVPVQIVFNKFYGSGGSPLTVTTVTSKTITNSYQNFSTPVIFGDNSGKNVGSLNDDYLILYLSFPTNISFSVLLDNFSLIIGNVDVSGFPVQTTRDFLVRSVSVATPDYDGYTFGLPVINTKDGLSYDYSQVGKVFPTVYNNPGFGELLCDGAMYRTDAYSNDGIPYKRLQQILTSYPVTPLNYVMPIFGTGDNYVTASDCNI